MTDLARTAARVLLGATMVGAGVLHLTTQRQEFRAQVPEWFPVDEDLTVLGSGVAEIVLGAAFGLDTDRTRLVRLFFQPLLVVWALYGGGWWRRDGRG